jgi:signal transduction histidine kinase
VNEDLAALKRRFEQLNLLHQVSDVIHSTLDPKEALPLVLREVVRLMRATSGSVVLINPTTGFLEIEAAHGLPPNASQIRLRQGEGITGWVARTAQPARVGNVLEDSRYFMVRPEVRSELAVPLQVQGELRGVLNVDSDQPDAFSIEDLELLEALAVQAARVIYNTWLYEQARLKARLFEALVSVGQTINSAVSPDDALKVITREACRLMDAKMCSLLLLDATREWLDLQATHGAGAAYLQKARLNVAESLLGSVVRRRRPLQVESVQVSGRYQNIEVARQEGLVSLLSVPLVFRDHAIGTLNIYTGEPHVFSNEEVRILSALAELSAVAIEKARLYDRLVAVEEQLRQTEKLSALGLLAAEVAHEIRNPLTVMKLLFHSLDLKFPSGDPRSRDVEIMVNKMDHLNRIVEQILDFARTKEPDYSCVNVNELIDDLALLTRHKLRGQGIELERRLQSGLPQLWADRTQLAQALLNLTLNAVEAMPDGGTLTIVCRGDRPLSHGALPSRIIIEFKDTGVGMNEEMRAQKLTSLLKTTKGKGTGLGLAIVRRVVEVHRGVLDIKSRPGKGTEVRLVLPIKKSS